MSSTGIPFQKIPTDKLPGVYLLVIIAGLSAVALFCVAFRAAWLGLTSLVSRGGQRIPSREYIFFHTQLGLYAACLLGANLFTSMAGLLAASWASQRGVREGMTCTAEALLMQVGNFATAYFTVIIAVHTFTSLVLRSRQSVWISVFIVAFGWISSLLTGLVPLAMANIHQGAMYGNDGFACGIRRVYAIPQFLFHLLPIFVAAVCSAILYSLIFLVLRGTLVFRGGLKLNLDPENRWNGRMGSFEEYHRFIGAIARSMLWYPFAYVVLLLPYSITRLMDLSGYSVPFEANVFAMSCTFVLGFINVVLLYNTFRVLGPAFGGLPSSRQNTDQEAFPRDKSFGEKSFVSYDEKVMPELHFRFEGPTNIPATPSSTHHHHKQTRMNSMDSSLRLLIPHQTHYRNGSMSSIAPSNISVSAEDLSRPITPMSELNRYVAAPPLALKADGLRPLKLSREATQSGLPPPPRPARTSSRPAERSSGRAAGGPRMQNHPSLTAVGRPTAAASPLAASPSEYGTESEIPPSPYVTQHFDRQ